MTSDPAYTNLLRYLHALERFDVPAVLECFTEDVIYNHHPFSEGHPGHDDDVEWHQVHGREELAKLMAFRGADNIKHHITAFARNGNVCFNEGWSSYEDDPRCWATWVSVFRVDDEGLIANYLTYVATTPLPLIGPSAGG